MNTATPEQKAADVADELGTFTIGEPVEVRISRPGRDLSNRPKPPYVLTAWRTGHGTVAHSLTVAGHGTAESLSNLQSRATFPGKAVEGWQLQVIEFARQGLGQVEEVR